MLTSAERIDDGLDPLFLKFMQDGGEDSPGFLQFISTHKQTMITSYNIKKKPFVGIIRDILRNMQVPNTINDQQSSTKQPAQETTAAYVSTKSCFVGEVQFSLHEFTQKSRLFRDHLTIDCFIRLNTQDLGKRSKNANENNTGSRVNQRMKKKCKEAGVNRPIRWGQHFERAGQVQA